jgi:voltage-gated potassium channel
MGGHYLVCGVGRSGEHAIRQMTGGGFPLVVVERSEEILREFMDYSGLQFPYVVGDATEENVLLRAGVARAQGIIAALPKDQDNIFLVLTARALNPKLRIVSKVNEQSSRKKLLQVGADVVVSPSEMGGIKMVTEMVRPGVSSFLEHLTIDTGENLLMDEVAIGAGSALHGRKLMDSEIRQRFNLLVVGVRGSGGTFVYNPAPDHVLESGMTLIVLGPREAIAELRKLPSA